MEINYKRHKFQLTRKSYNEENFPEVGEIVEEANSDPLEEFKVLRYINEKEVECLDLQTEGKRYFFNDSIRVHPLEVKRRKKEVQLKKVQEKWKKQEESKKRRAEKLLIKLQREEKKKNKQNSFSKKRELKIKFI